MCLEITWQNWTDILKAVFSSISDVSVHHGRTAEGPRADAEKSSASFRERLFWENQSVCFWKVRPKVTGVGVLRVPGASSGVGWAYLSGLCGGVHLWRWWGGEHNRGGLPGRKRGLQETGTGEQRAGGQHGDASYLWRKVFFFILLKTLFKIKINLL